MGIALYVALSAALTSSGAQEAWRICTAVHVDGCVMEARVTNIKSGFYHRRKLTHHHPGIARAAGRGSARRRGGCSVSINLSVSVCAHARANASLVEKRNAVADRTGTGNAEATDLSALRRSVGLRCCCCCRVTVAGLGSVYGKTLWQVSDATLIASAVRPEMSIYSCMTPESSIGGVQIAVRVRETVPGGRTSSGKIQARPYVLSRWPVYTCSRFDFAVVRFESKSKVFIVSHFTNQQQQQQQRHQPWRQCAALACSQSVGSTDTRRRTCTIALECDEARCGSGETKRRRISNEHCCSIAVCLLHGSAASS